VARYVLHDAGCQLDPDAYFFGKTSVIPLPLSTISILTSPQTPYDIASCIKILEVKERATGGGPALA
jgi:hypothetical protein